MILIGKYPSIKIKSEYSIFIKFKSFNPKYVEMVKTLPVRYYIPDEKVWEVPLSDMDRIVNVFGVDNIQMFTEFPEFQHYLKVREEKRKNKKSVEELIAYYEQIRPEVDYKFKTRPDGHQIEAFNTSLHLDSMFITDVMGLGKAQTLDSIIYTPFGKTTMGNIRVGDQVIGKDGKPHMVTGVFPQGQKQVFEVLFNDGSSTRCCKEHLWTIKTYYHGKWKTMELQDVAKEVQRVQRVYIPMSDPVQFHEKSVEIDPYVMGVLLGDGGFSSGYVGITSSDIEIISEVNKYLPKDHICEKLDCIESGYGFIIKSLSEHRTTEGNLVKNQLKKEGLWRLTSEDKFIPEKYIYNSIDCRISILQGLMDTDGYASNDGTLQFYSTSYFLADGVSEIVQSLGGNARFHICQGSYKKDGVKIECKEYYLITINLPDGINPFRLSRKTSRVRLIKKYKPTRIIRKIEYVGRLDCQCIMVDSKDHLYLTDDYIVTHNTKQAIDICDYKRLIGESKHVLVICGVNGLKYNWKDLEIPKHSWYNAQVIDGTKKQKIEKLKSYYMFYYNIINIESIRNNEKRNKEGKIIKENDNEILEILIKLCNNGKFDAIIIDEFHKANNHKSQQGKGLAELTSKFKIALSGTPITKKIERSWNILHWFGYETSSYWSFLKRYCVLGGFSGYDVVGYQNLDELHSRFDQYQIRRTKDILKLPPKVHQNVYVEMTNDERKEYNKIKNGIITDVESGETKIVDPMVATLKLRLFTDKIKVRAVKDFIEELQENDQPCVIFSCFKEGLNNLSDEISEYRPLICTGDLKKASDKQKVIDDFQDRGVSNVILGTTQAMGTGYTLTRSEYVGFLNKSLVCTDNEQAEDRCHRRGTTGSVTVVSFIVKDSIDERVEEILENDKLYISKVVDGIPIFKMSKDVIFDKLISE